MEAVIAQRAICRPSRNRRASRRCPSTAGRRGPRLLVAFATAFAIGSLVSAADAARFQVAGIPIEGNHFCITVDHSRAMGGKAPNPAGVSGELAETLLRRLTAADRFTLIAYHKQAMTFGIEGEGRAIPATDANRQKALAWLANVPCDKAPEHFRAAQAAVGSGADVVFFFTTGGEPAISNLELRKLKKHADGGPQIFVVELGWGDPLGPPKFTQRLAELGGGKVIYIDLLEKARTSAGGR